MNTNSKKESNHIQKRIQPVKKNEDYNPYNPEKLYKDFDFDDDQMEIDEVINRDNYENPYSNLTNENNNVKKNTFVYESFSDRIKKIKVKLSSNFQNDMSFLKMESKEGFKIKSNDLESNFLTILQREKVLNTSDEFKSLVAELNTYIQSYLIFINNSDKILKILSEKIHIQIEEKVKNFPFIISLMEILSGLIKDLRDETYDEFLDKIFPNLIKLLSETQNVEVIEKTFGVLVNIFKFLQNTIIKPRNFSNFFYVFSELIFNKTKYIRKFTCESITYLIKNLEIDKLSEIMHIILNPFINPNKYFELNAKDSYKTNDQNNESKNFHHVFINKIKNFDEVMPSIINKQNNHSIKNDNKFFINLIHEALLNFEYDLNNFIIEKNSNSLECVNIYNQKLKLKIFLVDCLSDFIMEILIGVNRDISIKADLFLEKLKLKKNSNPDNENYNEYLNFIVDLSVTTAIFKLFNKLKYEKRHSLISLLNFYLIKKINKDIKFNRLKSEKLFEQILNYKFVEKEPNINSSQEDKMDVEIANKKIQKNIFSQLNCFILMNYFILELFHRSHLRFDKDIKRFFFEISKLSLNDTIINREGQRNNIFFAYFDSENFFKKNYFFNNLKLDLVCLFIKFFPMEFSEFYQFDYITLNCYNKIDSSIDFDNKENENIFNLLKLFSNNKSQSLIDENILFIFLEKLKNLQKFNYFKSLSIFENRGLRLKNSENIENIQNKGIPQNINELGDKFEDKSIHIESLESKNPYIDNDDYNIDYNEDLINKIFSFIMNYFDFEKIENILYIKTTYDLILIKNSKNEEKSLQIDKEENEHNLNFTDNISGRFNHTSLLLANENNINLLVTYLNNFSVEEISNKISENINNNFHINNYIQIYSFLIIGDILLKSITILRGYLNKKNSKTSMSNSLIYNIIINQNNIYLQYIKKSIKSILIIFEKDEKKESFSREILKITNEEDEVLFSILFKDFNDLKVFYLEKNTSFLNLLDYFTDNYLKILVDQNESNSLQLENKEFIVRILSLLFKHCDNGVAFKTLNAIIKSHFKKNFKKFYEFCQENEVFFKRNNSLIKNHGEIYQIPSIENKGFIESLEEFLLTFSVIMYSNDNNIKKEFVIFIRTWLNYENNFRIGGADEIFDLIVYILSLEFEIMNDKKYSLNFEILISKLELITIDSKDLRILFVFIFFYDFLIGSYWIRLVKALWPVLTKCIERFFNVIENLNNEKLYFLIYNKSMKLFKFIDNIGTLEVLLENIEFKKFEKFYFVFSEKFEENNKNTIKTNLNNEINKTDIYMKSSNFSYSENIIISSFYSKRDNISSLALSVDIFYEGFLKSQHNLQIIINGSTYLLNEKNETVESKFYLFDDFYKLFARIINPRSESWFYDLYKSKDEFNSQLKTLHESNESNLIIDQNDDFVCSEKSIESKYFINYFNNFVSEKESKKYFSSTAKNLQESILTILSKLNFSQLYRVKQNNLESRKVIIKNILYDQLIFSRTQSIQKLCVSIYINLEANLKKFTLLFEKLIENSNLIDRLYNLNDIRTDGNEKIKEDERELLIPILIRLYYSKYFYITSNNKKIKTRNKINIVSFFIQLTPMEFREYIKVIFRPLMIFENFEKINKKENCTIKQELENDFLFCEDPHKSYEFINKNFNCVEKNVKNMNLESVKYLDLRIYIKIIEIISLNFKQINSLFESSIDFLSIFIMNVLIFIKKSNNFFNEFHKFKKMNQKNITNEEDEINFDNQIEDEKNRFDLEGLMDYFENSLRQDKLISDSKFMNYWNREKVLEYSNLYFKFIKEIKKNSFDLLKRIFSKFSYKYNLVKIISNGIFTEYSDIYKYLSSTENLKVNTLLQFTFNIGKNPHTHKIFIDNSDVFSSICNILSNKKIDNKFLSTLLEFLENIIGPYSEYKTRLLENREKNITQLPHSEYDELTHLNIYDKSSIKEKKMDVEIEDNIPRRRKLTTDSNLSFLHSEKDMNEKNENEMDNFHNRIRLKNEENILDHGLFLQNESKLIKENFKLFNENIINILTSGRLKLKIKETLTERTIYLLLELWNIYDVEEKYFQNYAYDNQETINKLLKFLIDFISKDSKIFNDDYKIYLSNILRLCNILISLSHDKSKYYLDFLHLIYKISDTSSRLILCVILRQICVSLKDLSSINFEMENILVDKKLQIIFNLLIELNTTKTTKSLESNDSLDVDQVLEHINFITEDFCNDFSIFYLEPLIYQLITLANFSDDFSIQTLAIVKIKILFDKIISYLPELLNEKVDNNVYKKINLQSFSNILKIFLNLLNILNYNRDSNYNNNSNNYGGENYISMHKIKQEKIKKNILDIFSYINSIIFDNKDLNEKFSVPWTGDVHSIMHMNMNLFDTNFQENWLVSYRQSISLILCRDLHLIKSEKGDYDFFEGIMNLKYEIRTSVLIQLKDFLSNNKVRYFSLLNIIIPVIKSFLNFEVDRKIKKSNDFDVFHRRNDVNSIVDMSIELMEPISRCLNKQDFLSFLMHFYKRINKANFQDSSKSFDENKYIFEKLYEVFSRLLECLNLFDFNFISNFDFDMEFNKTMRELISNYKNKADLNMFLIEDNLVNLQENKIIKIDDGKVHKFTDDKQYSKDLFKDSFNKISDLYSLKLCQKNYDISSQIIKKETEIVYNKSKKFKDFSNNLVNNIFSMLRSMLYDNYRKDKTKKYYIRNFVIKPFFLILKKMDPRTLKYELLSLVYEIMNNLKNKDLDVREKSRHAIRILIEILGPFISNVLLDQLKSQLTAGYQRFIMGYTCNYIIGILNKIYINFKEVEDIRESICSSDIYKNNNLDYIYNNDNDGKIINMDYLKENDKKSNNRQKNYSEILKEIQSQDGKIEKTNLDFIFLNKYKQFTKKDIELIFDFSIGIVVPILLDEIFGEISEEKEIDQLVKKYKEGKEMKAYNSFTIIASKMDFKTGILNLVFPIRNFVAEKETNNSLINKINEIMNYIIRGLNENTTLDIEDILVISYSLINIGLELNIKNSKEVKQNKKITIKGGDLNDNLKLKTDYISQKNELVSLQLGTNSKKKYSIEIAKKFIMEKNDIILSNLFTQFGLDVFLLAIKKNVFDFSSIRLKMELEKNIINETNDFDNKIKEEKEGESSSDEEDKNYQDDLYNDFLLKKNTNNHNNKNYYLKNRKKYSEGRYKSIIDQMEVLLYTVICCLKISSNNILSKSLKILTKLFDSRLFVIKKNLKKIGSNLFKNLGIVNLSDSDKTIAQTILSCISEILKKFSFYEITDQQIKLLINFLKIYINNLEIKSCIFSCLFSIIKRKFLHPCIYDMIDYIQETYLISFDEATKSLCENIIIEFLNNYPLEDSRKQKHINFFIINLESNTRNCVLNSLRMIKKFIDFSNYEIKKEKGEILSNKKDLLSQNSTNQVAIIVKDFIDFMLLKLLYLIANSSDSDVKDLSSQIIQEIFDHVIDSAKFQLYLEKILDWINIEEKVKEINSKNKTNNNESDDESDKNHEIDENYLDEKQKIYAKLGLNFLSILLNKQNENISNKYSLIINMLIKNLKFEFNKFEKQLDKQIENRNYSKLSYDSITKKKEFDKIFESENKEEFIGDETKISGLNLNEEEMTILSIQLENWDIYYMLLVSFEKLSILNPNLFKKTLLGDKVFAQILFRSIKHPHIFIKTVIMRLIRNIFNMESTILNMNSFSEVNLLFDHLISSNKNKGESTKEKIYLNTLQILLDNFKFILLNKEIKFKENIIEDTLNTSSFLIYILMKLHLENQKNVDEKTDFSFYAYEFICRIYGDSKKYLANKSYTNIFIKRILTIIENIINLADDNRAIDKNSKLLKKIGTGKELEIILEPVLSLLYRLTSNNLVEDEMKSYAEKIIESLRQIIDENIFSIKFKEVRNQINLLRKKRKIDQMETYVKDQKKFYNQKKKK